MNRTQTESKEQKEVAAVSKASYRGFEIIETKDGCTFFVGTKRYDFIDLGEATAHIDFIYADAARRVLQL